jgi:drug/metabolite transporter (DMT)-like permease
MDNEYARSAGPGYLCVVLAALLWAASGSASKFLFTGGVTPFQLVQLRTTIAGSLLLAWMLVRRRDLLSVERKDLISLAVLGVVLAVAQFTYLYAISRIQVAAAILLQYQAPVLIAAHAVLFGRRRLSYLTVAAIAGAILGCYLMVGAYTMDILAMKREGVISGLASAVAFALYAVMSEHGMRTYSPLTVLCYALLFAAAAWNVIHSPLAAFRSDYGASAWAWIFFIGTFGTVIPFGLYNKGIHLIRSTRASITATLEPVMAGIISYSFLGETMEPWQITGGGLVIASVLLLQIRKDPD